MSRQRPEKGGKAGPSGKTAERLPGPPGAALSSYYGMPEAGRGSGATGDEHLARAEDADLARVGETGRRKPAPTQGPGVDNPLADGSEDPLAVPVDLARDAESEEAEQGRNPA